MIKIILISVILAAIFIFLAMRLWRACARANRADWGRPWLNRLDGLNRILCHRIHGLKRSSIELPARGGILLASNHVSGLDPLLLIASSPRPLRFLIAREQYERWWLRWLFRAVGCIPVERQHNPRAALYAARRALEQGEVVALFPHGRIHLDHHAPTPLKRGIALLAQKTGAPIYPLRIEGVRGQGLTVIAVFIPSRARVHGFAPLRCADQSIDACLEKLANLLAPPTQNANPRRAVSSLLESGKGLSKKI